jgi:hypothetical protein
MTPPFRLGQVAAVHEEFHTVSPEDAEVLRLRSAFLPWDGLDQFRRTSFGVRLQDARDFLFRLQPLRRRKVLHEGVAAARSERPPRINELRTSAARDDQGQRRYSAGAELHGSRSSHETQSGAETNGTSILVSPPTIRAGYFRSSPLAVPAAAAVAARP